MKKSLLILLSVCCFSFYTFSQNSHSILSVKDSVEVINNLHQSNQYLTSDKTKALLFANHALLLCVNKSNPSLESKCYASIAASQRYNTNMNLLLSNGKKAINKATESKDKTLLLNAVYWHARDLLLFSLFSQCLEQITTLEQTAAEINTPNSKGLLAYMRGLYELKRQVEMSKAEAAFNESMALATQLNDGYLVALNKQSLFKTHLFMGKIDTTAKLAFEALEFFEKNGYSENVLNCKMQIGESYFMQGNFKKAHEYLDAIYPDIIKEKNCLDAFKLQSVLYQMCVIENRWEAAAQAIQREEEQMLIVHSPIGLGQVKALKARQYSHEGNYQKADTLFNEAEKVADEYNVPALKTTVLVLRSEHLNKQNKQHQLDSVALIALSSVQKTLSPQLLSNFYKSKADTAGNSKNKSMWLRQKLMTDSNFRLQKGLESMRYLKAQTDDSSMPSDFQPTLSSFDSSISASYNKQLLDYETQFRTRQKDDSLRIERQEAVIAEDNAHVQNIMLVSICLIALLLAGGFFLQYKNRRRAERDKAKIEMLQNEVHHRVKNNLGVINRLIEVAGKNGADQVSMQSLQTRVMAIELLHKRLYNDKLTGSISLQEYLLELTAAIQSMFETDKQISIHVNAPVEVSSKTAEKLGLIVNELVTNSYKYAFDEQLNGSIDIEAAVTDNHEYKLKVADNGKGFGNTRKNSYGMKLIAGLSHELNGEFAFVNNGGATFDLKFKDNS